MLNIIFYLKYVGNKKTLLITIVKFDNDNIIKEILRLSIVIL